MEFLRSDEQDLLGEPGLDQPGHDRGAVDEAGAGGVQVEGGGPGGADAVLDHGRRAGTEQFRRAGGDHDQVDLVGFQACTGHGPSARQFRHVGGLNVGDPAVVDAGALHYPLVAGVHEPLQVGVGQRHRRHAAPPSGDHGSRRHGTTSYHVIPFGS